MSAAKFTIPVPRRRRTLAQLFEAHEGRLIDKWTHYFDIYERHFAPFRNRSPRILEIGVSHGGSLELWQRWFGRGTTIVGIDIDPRTAALAERGVTIRIGDQGDVSFMRSVAERDGPFDIVIDDGSHQPAHQRASLDALWPAVTPGGIYLVEDLHANYWEDYGGALGDPTTFIEFAKGLTDDLHAFHSRTPDFAPSSWTHTLGGLHVYDSIIVLDRADRVEPTSEMRGRPSFKTLYGTDVADFLTPEHLAVIDEMNRPHRRVLRVIKDPVRSARRYRSRRTGSVPPDADVV